MSTAIRAIATARYGHWTRARETARLSARPFSPLRRSNLATRKPSQARPIPSHQAASSRSPRFIAAHRLASQFNATQRNSTWRNVSQRVTAASQLFAIQRSSSRDIAAVAATTSIAARRSQRDLRTRNVDILLLLLCAFASLRNTAFQTRFRARFVPSNAALTFACATCVVV
jgi:hypothetical protein